MFSRPSIMRWIGPGKATRGRSELAGDGADADWVAETCTWERFEAGLARTEAVKGVGVDGFNMYLMRRAAREVREGYWRDMQEVIRQHAFPDEWCERVAMMAVEPKWTRPTVRAAGWRRTTSNGSAQQDTMTCRGAAEAMAVMEHNHSKDPVRQKKRAA